MKCPNCKETINKRMKYCPKCGKEIRKNRNRGRSLFIFACLLIITGVVMTILYVNGKGNLNKNDFNEYIADDTYEEQDEEVVEAQKPENPSEADEYYWDNSKVIKVTDVKESKEVMSETDVAVILEDRGFDDYPITYEHSMDGEYDDEIEISKDSTEKHPMYQTYYMSKNGELWTIFVIEGTIIANPASFNLDSDLEAQVLISESKQLTSYDDVTNKFYVTIPKESAIIVKTVDKINAETLDTLTIEEINKL